MTTKKMARVRQARLLETVRQPVEGAIRSVPRAGWFLLGFLIPFVIYQITR